MSKSLTNHKQVRAIITAFLAGTSLFMLFVGECNRSRAQVAQQSQDVGQKQRPRRVGQTTAKPSTKESPAATPQQASSDEVDEGDVVRVETQLVSVPAVVTDQAGHPITGLRAENFAVFEDGQPQHITNFMTTEAPFEVALLLDTSGSTREDLSLIRRAANDFIAALRQGDRVAILAFNTDKNDPTQLATVDVLTKLTSDRDALHAALDAVGTSNGTPYYDALVRVADVVFRDPPRDEVRGRRAVVALTDGVDSASESEFAEARAKLLGAGVAAYFIEVNTEDFVEDRLLSDCRSYGTIHLSRAQLQRYRRIFVPAASAADYNSFCQMGPFERMEISRQLYNLARTEMNELARASGGRTFQAADLRAARAAFAQVANEIGTQYSLGYYPTNKARDGRFRQIRVEVRGPAAKGTQVRAREGYYAPKG